MDYDVRRAAPPIGCCAAAYVPSLTLSDKLTQCWLALGEAAVDPSVWPDVMERICEAVGAAGAGLIQINARTPDIPRTKSVDEEYNRYFGEGWHTQDSRVERAIPLILQGMRVTTDEDLFTYDDFKTDRYLNEFYFQQGLHSAARVAVNVGPAIWAVTFHRTTEQKLFDAEDARILATLPDRLSEVVALSTVAGRVALTGVTNALGLVHRPAIAIDRFGFVLDANDEAHRIFDDDLNISKRRLTTTDREAAASLQILVDRFLVTREDAPLAAEPIVVRRKGRRAIVVRTLPVPPAARNPFLGARALLTFTVTGERSQLDQEVLRSVFSLTLAEARLATLMAEGLSPEAAAEQLGNKRETTRHQLKAIFAKTDTNRQAQLVALLSSLHIARGHQPRDGS